MSYGYYEYKKFRNFYPVVESELSLAKNYICLQLNDHDASYPYYYDMYSYAIKCSIVLNWSIENNLNPITKLGEAICKDEIVNFLEEDEHKGFSCSSVYFNAVF